ncbi:PTS system mannose/fructose/N-acetylgalactosamine-transporter subunit IIB [Marinilactibacillus psychrotolerans]|uniref:PTS system mannose/fructose/N-acetylgalactosamine-transporter subunit IIB n=1 Tax=Marinilactibacillus psychrotolerans TaxID=191770 RepID=UPI0038870ED6
MAISFMRIDDRIIHGQVVTRWMSERDCDGVVAVDDAAASNPVLSKVLKTAVPQPLKAFVMTVDRTALKWKEITESKKKYFLIVKTPETLVKLYDEGADFIKEYHKLNVGPMSAREDAQKIGPNVSVTKEEIAAFDRLDQLGVEIEFKLVPDSKGYLWKDIKKI